MQTEKNNKAGKIGDIVAIADHLSMRPLDPIRGDMASHLYLAQT